MALEGNFSIQFFIEKIVVNLILSKMPLKSMMSDDPGNTQQREYYSAVPTPVLKSYMTEQRGIYFFSLLPS